MISTAVILAAGKGTRMLDLAKDLPKHMILINGKPFLYYLLSNLKEAGITRTIIVVGHLKEKIEEYAETLKDEFDITLVDQFEIIGTDSYGTACATETARGVVGAESFINVFGDNVYSVEDIKTLMIDDDLCYAGGLENDHPERYSIFIEQDGFLEHIIEKPTAEVCSGHLVNPGLYKFTPEIFDAIDMIDKSVRGEYELPDAVTYLAHQKKVKVLPLKGPWLDLGHPEDVEIVSNELA